MKNKFVFLSIFLIAGTFLIYNWSQSTELNDQIKGPQIDPSKTVTEKNKIQQKVIKHSESIKDCSKSLQNCNNPEQKPNKKELSARVEESPDTSTYYITDPDAESDLSLEEIRKRVKLSDEEQADLDVYVDKLDYNEEGRESIRKIWLDMKASKIASRAKIYDEVMDAPMPGTSVYDSDEPFEAD